MSKEDIAKEAAEEIVENQWKWAAGKSHTERMQVIILSAITKARAEALREAAKLAEQHRYHPADVRKPAEVLVNCKLTGLADDLRRLAAEADKENR